MRSTLALAILSALALPVQALEIDGRIDPAEWADARHISEFRLTQPLSWGPAPQPTEAWVKSTPEGLAIAFRNLQSADVPRTRHRTRRDEDAPMDRVNVVVDFDGDGRTGYNFMVTLADGIADEIVTNESNFRDDWDGNWQRAVTEDESGWYVEMLIPWYIAPMRKAEGDTRTIGLYLDRVIGHTGERVASVNANWMRPRYLSDFEKVEVAAHTQSLLAVTPYVVGVHDQVGGDQHFDAGADIFWKPNGQTQLTATINPDFGQVESDDLVVNFGAEETFFSDKRPFFTENQGVFDFGLLMDNSQLIYTRRVGGHADDGRGPAEIAAAVKLNGSLGATNYGVMMAEEKGNAGRSFSALRLQRELGAHSLGLMATHVDRPWLQREANVVGVDHRWKAGDKVTVMASVVGSDIRDDNTVDVDGVPTRVADDSRDSGATLLVNYEMNPRWRHQWLAMHFGGALEINDFGYLSRNNLNYGHWQVSRRFTELPAESAYSGVDLRLRAIGIDNDDGLRLQRQFRTNLQAQRRDGGEEYAQLNVNSAAYDDLLTRGGHALYRPSNASLSWERFRPRKGDWSWKAEGWVGGGGLSGNRQIGAEAYVEPTYSVSDALNVFAGLSAELAPDWLVWRYDNIVGRYRETALSLSAGVNWAMGERQELRVKLQAIGLDAELKEAVEVLPGGRARTVLPAGEPVTDFSLRNLGFQVRYRYELAPLSHLYVVYGRGGYMFDEFSTGAGEQWRDSFSLRDSEQLLVKLAYRFEL